MSLRVAGAASRAVSVLVAPDSFKGTFSARSVASAASAGVEAAGAQADACPTADGGEGTMEVVLDALHGTRTAAAAHDPLGRPLDASLGWLDEGETALVEAAQTSGLQLLSDDEREPERASTYGTGELIAAAAAAGARRVLVALGGTATCDGGAGALQAIQRAGGLGGARLVVLCDVQSPFEHAAVRYAPQKGADAAAVARLTARLHEQAAALPRDPRGLPMTGAAGGLAGALWASFGARLVKGAAWVLDALEADARLARADAAILGEGRLDGQSSDGKVVGELAARCLTAGVTAHAIVGSCRLQAQEITRMGLASVRLATTLAEIEAASAEVAASVSARRCA